MINNDILRRLRFSFEFNDKKLISLFALADLTVDELTIRDWLKKEDDAGFVKLTDQQLASFLNGLIVDKRGAKDGAAPVNEKRLTNNIILTKLKIALNLQSDDLIALFSLVDFRITKPELSAFFRKPDHQNFRECKDQVLRNLLSAIQKKYRVSPVPKSKTTESANTRENKADFNPNLKKENPNKTARQGVSKIYVNPNATPKEKTEPTRKVLKLKPEDIWKNHE